MMFWTIIGLGSLLAVSLGALLLFVCFDANADHDYPQEEQS
jgi:hypothetical protein